MNLTDIAPRYELSIPSTGEKYLFKPYTVKHEKMIASAREDGNLKVVMEVLSDVIKDCFFQKLNVDELTIYDYETVLAHLRAKSINEKIQLTVQCEDCPEDDDKASVKINFDVLSMEIDFPGDAPLSEKTLILDEAQQAGVVMEYPKYKLWRELIDVRIEALELAEKSLEGDLSVELLNNFNDKIIIIAAKCIKKIFKGEEMRSATEMMDEDLIEYIENLNKHQYKMIDDYLNGMPRLKKEIPYECPVCNKKDSVTVEGLQTFFI